MFTGIVQCTAQVKSLTQRQEFTQLLVCVKPEFLQALNIGASVAINGVCLTVVEFSVDDTFIRFDVIDETLRVTNLVNLVVGSKVNLERSLKFGDEVGGHMVSGHIHCQASLIHKKVTTDNCALIFSFDEIWGKYIMSKGFISINGASLTIGEVTETTFSVHLIPETLSLTNLGDLTLNDTVNLEFDQTTMTIVNTIERMNLALNI